MTLLAALLMIIRVLQLLVLTVKPALLAYWLTFLVVFPQLVI